MNPLNSVKKVATVLDCSPQNVYTLIQSGAMRAVVFRTREGRWSYRVRTEDLETFITSNLREGVIPAPHKRKVEAGL